MTEAAQPSRLVVTQDSRLRLPRHIKLRHDQGRGKWLILAPERVFEPDEISVEVLKLCDGERSVSEIAQKLAADYQAPVDVILTDVIAMLQDLADKGVLKS
ncbi:MULTISPECIES: pyrroloquinoline quinone biosynthesis peptide chaperone PqqD [Filomicrobium]|nr:MULTISPECIES: pyrroloquinoline quinone biosynthesis peptide chaperone PqqD [Filomicrobium]MCV0370989.1 pyrroloquinoline quinone biosynthesis peptide chaperone PqqD [Filomicrobium sp.]SDP43379.1 pyrroloquinoline quinone biosynthesis protein D [Filomicrobium insigne]